nr:acetyltransferase [Vibrio cholerae]
MVSVVAIEFSVMRCQPLRRALAIQIEFCTNNKVKI